MPPRRGGGGGGGEEAGEGGVVGVWNFAGCSYKLPCSLFQPYFTLLVLEFCACVKGTNLGRLPLALLNNFWALLS